MGVITITLCSGLCLLFFIIFRPFSYLFVMIYLLATFGVRNGKGHGTRMEEQTLIFFRGRLLHFL
jgi:hypothetical protein